MAPSDGLAEPLTLQASPLRLKPMIALRVSSRSPSQNNDNLESSVESLADAVEGLAMVFITSLDENAEELVDESVAVDKRINLPGGIHWDAVERLQQERMMMELYYFKGLGYTR